MNLNFTISSSMPITMLMLQKNKYIIINNHYYLLLPKTITCKIEKNVLTFTNLLENNDLLFNKFKLKVEILFKKQVIPYTRKLIFKGLGYKFNLSSDNKRLELKLGYSHLHRLVIPSEKIQLKLLKNAIVLSSKNLSLLGNFLFKIRKLRIPNSYKGKGIWYKNEKKKLKIIKKK